MNCVHCGKEFLSYSFIKKYCSRKCQLEVQQARRRERYITKKQRAMNRINYYLDQFKDVEIVAALKDIYDEVGKI